MTSLKRPKASKWPRRLSYTVLVSLLVLIGFMGFGVPKSDGKLLLANGDVFRASQRCLETGEANLPKNIRDAIVASRSEGWLDFHPLVIPVFNIVKTGLGGATLASETTMHFINPSKGNQHGSRFLYALELEWTAKKCALFELYAERAFFFNQTYGIANASKRYFSKKPADLSIAQAAFLMAIERGPFSLAFDESYPSNVKALSYRNKMIERMRKRGLITKRQAVLAKHEPIQFQ